MIVGAGGHGRETLDIVEAVNRVRPTYDFLGFLDDDPHVADVGDVLARRGSSLLGRVGAPVDADVAYVIAIGSPEARRRIDTMPGIAGRTAATLVHPSVTFGADVEIGPGALLAAGARITTNVRAGRHVHLNVAATVAHDCRLGDYVSLSPGAHLSGNVTLGQGVFLGTGAVVNPGCQVGEWAVVGAGAVVIGDVEPGATVVGVPARPVA